VTEKSPLYEYRIPDYVADSLPESQLVSVYLMDDLLFEVMGIHFLEPLVSFDEKVKCRP